MAVTKVLDSADAIILADHLLNPVRESVVVVVSTRGTDGRVMFDVPLINAECGDRAEVWLVPSGQVGLAFSDRLPEMGRVFGGAARVYPKGSEWSTNPYSSPLFFAYDNAEAERRVDSLIDTAMELSYAMAPDTEAPKVSPVTVTFTGPRPTPASVAAATSTCSLTSRPASREASAVPAGPASIPRATPGPRPSFRPAGVPAQPTLEPAPPVRGHAQLDALAALVAAKADLRLERMEHAQDRLAQEIEIAGLRRKLADQQDLHRERTQAERKRRGAIEQATAGSVWAPELFMDPEDAVRHAISLSWVERVPAAEKGVYALPVYEVGPDFADSIDLLVPAQQAKAFRCVVDVLTDRARDMAARRVHPLRNGAGGDNGQRTRDDGAVCFRANIETSTASARRLHWWKNIDGSVELSRVVIHDDMGS